MKGLLVRVYRWQDETDCTNGGVTGKAESAILIWEDMPKNCKVFEPDEDTPVLMMVPHNGYTVMAVPMERPAEKPIGEMFGGNFIYSSDSRFPVSHPIHVFDRYETQDDYNHLSR